MTQNKKVSLGKVAGISLLSIVMIFAAAAPSLTQVHAGDLGGDLVKFLDDASEMDCLEIEIVQTDTTRCAFFISYSGDTAIVEDTVPAEWEVMSIEGDVDCTFVSAGKKVYKSATKITCTETDEMLILVTVQTRESPATKDKANKVSKFKPTSCGDLVLNDGAVAYASEDDAKILVEDDDGNLVPIVIFVSNQLILDAVNPDGLDCEGSPDPDVD